MKINGMLDYVLVYLVNCGLRLIGHNWCVCVFVYVKQTYNLALNIKMT